jgi:hypothetical protein
MRTKKKQKKILFKIQYKIVMTQMDHTGLEPVTISL